MTDLQNAGQGADQANPPSLSEEPAVPTEVAAKFDEVFGPSSSDAAKPEASEAVKPATNRRSERAQTRRSAAVKEQDDELEQQSLPVDGSDEPPPETDEQPPQEQQGQQRQTPKAGKEDGAPSSTLDPVLRHAARRMGWPDDKIAEFHKANPDLAEDTFERFHGQLNDLSVRYAQLGQQQQQQYQPPPPQQPQQQAQRAPQQQPQQQAADNMLDRLFQTDTIEEMRAVHGDDLVDKFIVPLQREIVQPFREVYQFVQQQRTALMAQQVNQVFDGLSSEGFQDLYGSTGAETPEQVSFKQQVLQIADSMYRDGKGIPIPEAIDRAHVILTAQRRGEIERKKLTEQVRNRSSRLTARPTQRRVAKTVDDGAKRSEQAAIEAYQQRAAEIGFQAVDED